MPIDDEALAAHIEKHGPVLFHVADAKHHEAIMRDGLRPGSELGCFMRDDFSHASRACLHLRSPPEGSQ